MGLDVHVYRLTEPCSPAMAGDESVNPKTFWLSEGQLQRLRRRWPDLQAERLEFFDSEKLAKDCNIPDSFVLDTWDLSIPQGWAVYVDMDEKQPDRRVEVESKNYLGVKDEYQVEFIATVLSDLRKPFRGASSSAVQEGDTLTLTLRNFSNTVEGKMAEILGEDAMNKCYALLPYGDLSKLQALKDLCDYPEDWQQVVLDKMTDELCVTVIDW